MYVYIYIRVQGDYMAAQIREEREDTDVMIGREVGGRSVTPDPNAKPRAPATGTGTGTAEDQGTAPPNGGEAATAGAGADATQAGVCPWLG
jgi:hypothetical protein